ncbi:MAG: NIL domain-containing protein [Chloroflexi bacterium]|nr:NIL domain-containing protein [Chloroflexota bacterium]
MAEQVVRLIYPPALLNTPIINLLIRTYSELVVNIIRAEVDTNVGWLEVQLVGNPGLIESAISWLREQGVEVNTLSA